MKMFENRIEGNTSICYKSRVVASFINEGGNINSQKFIDYLDKLVELNWIQEKDKDDIIRFATNGKMELEYIAQKILLGY